MDSRKALFVIFGSLALTTLIGILLNPYKDSSGQKKIGEKSSGDAGTAGETIKESDTKLKTRLKKMGEDANRMVNEGGNAL